MSELQHYYNEVARNSSTWADPDPSVCGCKGGGWWLSDVDTWHKCPIHNPGAPHPEFYEIDISEEEMREIEREDRSDFEIEIDEMIDSGLFDDDIPF